MTADRPPPPWTESELAGAVQLLLRLGMVRWHGVRLGGLRTGNQRLDERFRVLATSPESKRDSELRTLTGTQLRPRVVRAVVATIALWLSAGTIQRSELEAALTSLSMDESIPDDERYALRTLCEECGSADDVATLREVVVGAVADWEALPFEVAAGRQFETNGDEELLRGEQQCIDVSQLDAFIDRQDLQPLGHRLERVSPPEPLLARDPLRGPLQVWRVFREGLSGGYSVVFDPASAMFGLSMQNGDETVLIGLDGSLVDAIQSM